MRIPQDCIFETNSWSAIGVVAGAVRAREEQPAKELVVMSTLVAGWSRLAAAMQHTGPPAGRLPAVGRPVPRSRQQIARSREQDASNAEPMGAFPGEDAPGTGAAEGMAAAFVGRGPKCIGNQELPVRCLPIRGVEE